jgi:four helix bundle protein
VQLSRDVPNQLAEQLKERTMRYALRVMRFCKSLPDTWEGHFVADQLFRSGARTAANYRSTCRARSRREFAAKMGTVVEESDESVFWLTFAGRSGMSETVEQKDLLNEGRELVAIFTSSAKTATENLNRQ